MTNYLHICCTCLFFSSLCPPPTWAWYCLRFHHGKKSSSCQCCSFRGQTLGFSKVVARSITGPRVEVNDVRVTLMNGEPLVAEQEDLMDFKWYASWLDASEGWWGFGEMSCQDQRFSTFAQFGVSSPRHVTFRNSESKVRLEKTFCTRFLIRHPAVRLVNNKFSYCMFLESGIQHTDLNMKFQLCAQYLQHILLLRKYH